MVLLLGVDRFMSEARAITNTIGNAVGTVVVARWVGAVDRARMARVLDGAEPACGEEPAARDDAVVGLAKPQNVSV
jgi:aerobic C4-dicarboxylate transport protein